MAYCTYLDVQRVIRTSMPAVDITALIVLADLEITDRELTARSNVKTISMFLTASMIAMREPRTVTMGGTTLETPVTAREWREAAEDLINRGSGGLPIYVGNDPLPNE